jgi:hypothetical protein
MIVNMFCLNYTQKIIEEEKKLWNENLDNYKNSIPLSLEWLALMQNKEAPLPK